MGEPRRRGVDGCNGVGPPVLHNNISVKMRFCRGEQVNDASTSEDCRYRDLVATLLMLLLLLLLEERVEDRRTQA